MSPQIVHGMMSQQRGRRREINAATRRTLVLYCIAVSFSHVNHSLVAVGFSFATLPKAQWSKLQMGNGSDEDDAFHDERSSRKRQPRKPRARMKKSVSSAYSSLLLPPPAIGKGSSRRRWGEDDRLDGEKTSSEVLNTERITTPLVSNETLDHIIEKTQRQAARPSRQQAQQSRKRDTSTHPTSAPEKLHLPPPSPEIAGDQNADLPEWGALFSNSSPSQYDVHPSPTHPVFPSPVIEGVLPVSELFYRSTQSISSADKEEGDENEDGRAARARKRKRAKSYKNAETDGVVGDDEELPFSAEQSDRLSTPGNKIQIRRNQAADSSMLIDEIASGIGMGLDGNKVPSEAVRRELKSMARQEQVEQRQLNRRLKQQRQQSVEQIDYNHDKQITEEDANSAESFDLSNKQAKSNKKKLLKAPKKVDRATGRKMVRRGMEMLVGGEPINADPPQRAVELSYFNKHPRLWYRSISLNSPDFGPILHMHGAGKISKKEVGLYCENFVHNAQKWNICPEDLKDMVTQNELRIRNDNAAADHASAVDEDESEETEADGIKELKSLPDDGAEAYFEDGIIRDESGRALMFNTRELISPKGFGPAPKKNTKKKRHSRGGASGIASDKPLRKKDIDIENVPADSKLMFTLGGELKFSLGVTKAELESGHEHGKAFRRVLQKGIGLSIHADQMGFDVAIAKLVITDSDGGTTDVVVQFSLESREPMEVGEAERVAKDVNGALANAMDDGKMAMALAQMAKDENGWSAKVRNRVVEEFLFETEDDEEDKEFEADDDETEEFGPDPTEYGQDELYDGPFGMAGDPTYDKDDLWLGGGNGGVFFDYSESNILNSPYKGTLGPHLLDAAAERARQNQPRVIAIGDVHGCIDELQALLRKCDYHPGDTVVFLGDLVCKGPDSLSVVQMAREIGAIGVRGNHDFEVVRWHQAIKSGADPPVIGSEHYYVASALSTADLKWMYTLPWFISSAHLNALFVHAGFVSGIRLAKQNPRLMMNMRSILPDGTVTSKFFNNWPWARLWDGPQTVFFGHDADRGLQQYEHAVGLDTGCVYGGKLTACILPERRLVSVNAKREYFQYRRKHFD